MPAFARFVEGSEIVSIAQDDLLQVRAAFEVALKPIRAAVLAAHDYFRFLSGMWSFLEARDGKLFIRSQDYLSKAVPLSENKDYQKKIAVMREAFISLSGPIDVLVARLERAGLDVRYPRNVEALRQFRNEVSAQVLEGLEEDYRHIVEFVRDDLQWYVRNLSRMDSVHAARYRELDALLRQIQFGKGEIGVSKGISIKERIAHVIELVSELADVVGNNELIFEQGTLGDARQARSSAQKRIQYNIEHELYEEVARLEETLKQDESVRVILGQSVSRLLSIESLAILPGVLDTFKRAIDAKFTPISVSVLLKRLDGLVELMRKVSPSEADELRHLFVRVKSSQGCELVKKEVQSELARRKELGGLRRYLF